MTERPPLFDEPTQPLARSWREAFARLSSKTPPCPGFSPCPAGKRWSCPLEWCRSADPRQGPRFGQAATADSLSMGSSLKVASDSRLM
jgi:hypothetical protein